MSGVYINACKAYIPSDRLSVVEAVSQFRYDSNDAELDGYESAAIERLLWPADMALLAGKGALLQACIKGEDLSLLSYSAIHRHGHKHLWQPASYLQHELHANSAMGFSLNHGCNSMMLAAGLALEHCEVDTGRVSLILSADRFEESYFNRWRSDYGLVYGDAAVAALFSSEPGPLRIVYFDQQAASSLEGMHRMSIPVAEHDTSLEWFHDVREAKRRFLSERGRAEFESTLTNALMVLRQRLLSNTCLRSEMADWLILPNVGKRVLSSVYEPAFSDLALDDMWRSGRTIGHAGAADQFLGLAKLLASDQLKPGQLVLLVGAGAGFSCSILLVEVTGL